MKKRNKNNTNVLKRAVAFGLSVLMCVGNVPSTALATESEGSDIVVESSSESEAMAESETEPGTELAVDGSDVDISVDEPVAEEPTENTSEGTTEGSEEGSTEEVPTEAPTEGTEGDSEAEVTPTVTPETEGVDVTPTEAPTEEVAEPTVTPTPTPTEVPKPEFDYEGTYNALYSSWSGDYDKTRETLVRKIVNLTQKVKYHSGAGHSSMYLNNCGISDTNADLFTAENPEYLDDSGLIAWGYYQVGFKEFAQWVADYGLSGAEDTDYLQSVEYAQILPGDIVVASDGWSAIYGGSLDGSPVYIGSYWAEDNGELGVCCDTEYRKDFVKFYRYTGLTDAIKEEEGTPEGTLEGTENTEETDVEPTEIPEEETTENTENTEPTVLTYSDEDVDITATIENGETFGIEEFDITGLELKADAIEEGTEEYNAYVEEVTKSLGDAPEGKKYDFKPYDVYFEYKGEKVEPESGNVQVEMKFKDWVTDYESSSIAHIKGSGEVENLNNDSAEKDTFKFNVSSFSLMGPVLVAVDDAEYDTVGAYGMVYKSGECIIQRGNKPDSSKGVLVGTVKIPEYNDGQQYDSTTDYVRFYKYNKYITSVYVKDVVSPRSCYYMFNSCNLLCTADFSNLDVSHVGSFTGMLGYTKIANVDLSSWNIEGTNVNMSYFLDSSYLLESVKIGSNFVFPSYLKNFCNSDDLGVFTDTYGSFSDLTAFKNFWNKLEKNERKETTITFGIDNGYAILYDNGLLSIQSNPEVDSTNGSVVKIFNNIGNNSGDYRGVKWYDYRDEITDVKIKDNVEINGANWWFSYMNLNSLSGLSNLSFKLDSEILRMFYALHVDSLDVSGLSLKNVVDVSYAFSDAVIGNLNVTGFFDDCGIIKSQCLFMLFKGEIIGLNTLDYSKCDDMYNFFYSCTLKNPEVVDIKMDISNVSKERGIRQSFSMSSGIEKVKLVGIPVYKGTIDIAGITYGSKVKEIDFSDNVNYKVQAKSDYMSTFSNSLERFYINCDFSNNTNSCFERDEFLVKSEKTGKILDISNLSKDDLVFSGNYYKLKKVSFVDDENIVTKDSYIGDKTIDVPNPTREGSTFIGWYTKKTGGEKLNIQDGVKSLVYYSRWDDNNYTLRLVDKFTNYDDVTLGMYEGYILPKPSKKDYIFIGWNTRENGKGVSYDAEDVVKNLGKKDEVAYLYAQWKKAEVSYTVSFLNEDGTILKEIYVNEKGKTSKDIDCPLLSKEGFYFKGWILDGETWCTRFNNFSEIGASTDTIDKDLKYNPSFGKLPKVTLDYAGYKDNEVFVSKRNVTCSLPILDNVVFGGYRSFEGWYTSKDFKDGDKVTSYHIESDTTFYAKIGYRPRYNANGGVISNLKNFMGVQDSSLFVVKTLPNAEREGYSFEGWYLADGKTKVNIGDEIDLSKGVEFCAHWSECNFVTVKFKIQGKNAHFNMDSTDTGYAYEKRYKVGDKLGTNYWFTYNAEGLEFKNWVDIETNEIYTKDSTITKDLVLNAVFSNNFVTVTFNPLDGKLRNNYPSNYNIEKGSSFSYIPAAMKSGFVFDGWYTDINGGSKLTLDTKITDDVEYYAKYRDSTLSDSDSDSIFTFSSEWFNTSNYSLDNVDDNLNFHPNGFIDDLTASMHVRFEVNKSIGEKKLKEGSVKITIPKNIFKGYDDEFVDTCNLSANVPKYPNKRSGMWFSYIENEDTYTILNNTELSGGAGLDLIVSYTTKAYKVPGGGVSENGKRYLNGYKYFSDTMKVLIDVDKDSDSISDYHIEKQLSLEVHTSTYAYIRNYEGDPPSVKYSWDNSWGPTMDNDSEYFYIVWNFRVGAQNIASQLCNLIYNCSSVENGEFVKYYTNILANPDKYQTGTTYKYPRGERNMGFYYAGVDNISVITRHKKSLLENAPQEGVKFGINVDLDTENLSGYTVRSSAYNSKVLYGSTYPTGEFDKNNGYIKEKEIKGGQDYLLNDSNVELNYYLSYSGSSRNTAVIWDEGKNTYHADSRTVSIKDGEIGDLMYSSGYGLSSPYVWEPDSGNILLNDSDYYIKSIDLSVVDKDSKFEDGSWCIPYNKYPKNSSVDSNVEIFVRYKNSSDFVYYKTVSIPNSHEYDTNVKLGEDVVGVEIRYATDSYAVDVDEKATYVLKPSSKIKNLISKDLRFNCNSIIKNKAICNIWNTKDSSKKSFFYATNYTGGNNPANKETYYLTSGKLVLKCLKSASNSDNIIYDAEKGIQDNKMKVSGELNYDGYLIPLTSGKFYDLLPYGTYVDKSTVEGTYFKLVDGSDNTGTDARLDKGLFDVEFIENYKNTNRTMMIISFRCIDRTYQMSFSYYLRNTYSNIIVNGTSLENEVAFVNTSDVRKAYTSFVGENLSTMSSCFKELEEEYKGFIAYDYDNTHYIPVNAFSWGFDKSVKTDSYYSQSDSTLPNNEYTYKLTYAQSNQTSSKKIVFYDVLENGTDRTVNGSVTRLTPQWTGTLQNVDVDSIKTNVSGESTDVFCSPVIYYSTKDRSSFTGADFDVSKSDVWTTTKPSDASTITAIAVDCSKASDGSEFVLKDQKVLEVYVTMKAPGSTANYNKTTYNEAYVYSQKGTDTTSTFEHSDSDVTIKEPNVTLEKSSDPVTGTHEKHKVVYVDDTVTYTLKVTNTGDRFSLKDVVVEDVIPNYMDIDTYNMKVKFGESGTEVKVSQSPRVTRKVDGQKLTFTIKSLSSGESAYLIIPTTVTKSKEIFDNTAKITSVNGVVKEVVSETMHHESLPIGLTFKKADLNGSYITGAKMQLLQDGSVLREWNTTGKDEFFELKPGDYTIHEVTAPKGYILADDITFTLGKTGEVTVDGTKVDVVTMTDKFDKYKVRIVKVDTNGELLSGADLKVTGRENGESADITPITWTSDDNYKELELRPGTYKLTEVKAPDGYKVAKDIEFVVTDEGKLTVNGEEVTEIEMIDEEDIPEKGSITIVKYDTDGKTTLEGVTFNIHLVKYVDDITQGKVPSGGTEEDEEDNDIAVLSEDNWSDIEKTTGSNGKVVFDNLFPGVYEITETKTVSGKTLLADKITATIPMVANQDEVDDKGMDTSKAFYSKSKRLYFFFDVVYNVTNNSNMSVPMTGSDGIFDTRMLFGGMFVVLTGIGVVLVGKRKKEGGEG